MYQRAKYIFLFAFILQVHVRLWWSCSFKSLLSWWSLPLIKTWQTLSLKKNYIVVFSAPPSLPLNLSLCAIHPFLPCLLCWPSRAGLLRRLPNHRHGTRSPPPCSRFSEASWGQEQERSLTWRTLASLGESVSYCRRSWCVFKTADHENCLISLQFFNHIHSLNSEMFSEDCD